MVCSSEDCKKKSPELIISKPVDRYIRTRTIGSDTMNVVVRHTSHPFRAATAAAIHEMWLTSTN